MVNMSTAATAIADFIQQFVHQQQFCQGACMMTGEKGYLSVDSCASTRLGVTQEVLTLPYILFQSV